MAQRSKKAGKPAPNTVGIDNNPQMHKKKWGYKKPYFFQIFLILVGITLTVLGILRGETLEILRKAIVVCLECIGIG